MAWLGWMGHAAVALSLAWLALLSRRLGRVTRARPYYIGLLVAAGCVGGSAVVRLVNDVRGVDTGHWVGWALIYNGLPALGLTIAVYFAWRYWSWLFAERD